MQAIQTRWKGPSSVRGSRIIAECAAKRIIVDCDDRWMQDDNHANAAKELARRLGWDEDSYGEIVSGSLKDGSYVHVFVKRATP